MPQKTPKPFRVTFTAKGHPIVHYRGSGGANRLSALLDMVRDPLARMCANDAVRAELSKRLRGERALAGKNTDRKLAAERAEDARRDEIERLHASGRSLAQIAIKMGWRTAAGKPARTKVCNAMKRWRNAK